MTPASDKNLPPNDDFLPTKRSSSIRMLWLLSILALLTSTLYPSDLACYELQKGSSIAPQAAYVTENYGRFINTALQIGLPLAYRDVAGIVQLAKVAIATTLATHGAKRLLNGLTIRDTRLGQRPSSPNSRHNMPSGHSSMASSGFYFVCRRYGWMLAILTLPIMLLTMHARVALDMHTISAVISGALLGIMVTAIFTTKRETDTKNDAAV
ncbi:lipid A 1-phosphatase LpxE [Lysobacter pythonis]|uniref:Lipid A 1-phosphatase LpxE n=1 Tax=Solilutibacter pythonis TaxID=2483112 RepID=A0A3M2HHC7_9GAMM|nr:lipid A 1-phosphatase LpxE [Lysobacter pythonis]RMH88378.1 lipid A 1-phosphatase LpxE [Lysobacter pythonis]